MKNLTPIKPLTPIPGSLLETDYAEPYDAWKTSPGPASNAMFLKKLEPVMQGAIRTHVGEPNPLLVSRARLMTLEGLKSYDPTRGRLQTHLYNHLQGLKRANREQTQILNVPERVQLDHYHLGEAEKELTNTLGREPSDGELADHTGFSMKRLATLRRYHPAAAEGAMADPETGAEYSGEVHDPHAELNKAAVQLIYDDLDPYHQRIMELAMGLNGRRALPNDMIAMKMNRSPGAISQAKERIQRQLDEINDLM